VPFLLSPPKRSLTFAFSCAAVPITALLPYKFLRQPRSGTSLHKAPNDSGSYECCPYIPSLHTEKSAHQSHPYNGGYRRLYAPYRRRGLCAEACSDVHHAQIIYIRLYLINTDPFPAQTYDLRLQCYNINEYSCT